MYFLTNWTLSMEGIHFGGYIKMVNAYILDQKQNILYHSLWILLQNSKLCLIVWWIEWHIMAIKWWRELGRPGVNLGMIWRWTPYHTITYRTVPYIWWTPSRSAPELPLNGSQPSSHPRHPFLSDPVTGHFGNLFTPACVTHFYSESKVFFYQLH